MIKDRLIEDWLTRINERGFESSFCQILLSQGFQVLRCGHSPTEHGKDVLAISPDGAVCAYQLKSGDFSQADVSKHHAQLIMLVETRPIHPGLPASFEYRPYFVTTGEFKDPAVSLIRELNAGWQHRNLPTLTTIGGQQLLADFIKLSSDFWPVEAPEVRRFRELYLTDGRSDFEINQFSTFLAELLRETKSGLDLERRAAAANVFCGYLLGEFYKHADHWSIIRGWTICAAHISWAGLSGKYPEKHWIASAKIAKEAALAALKEIGAEALKENAFDVRERELDDYTRTRNTCALAAACCWQLVNNRTKPSSPDFQSTLALLKSFLQRGRLLFLGEGALSQFLLFFWMLEVGGDKIPANSLLIGLIGEVSLKNARESKCPLENPYVTPDEFLEKLFAGRQEPDSPRRVAVESYSLFPLVILAVRRGLRAPLEEIWLPITDVALAWFRPDATEDSLLWRCDKGKEYSQSFVRPQSWKELQGFVTQNDQERVPSVLRDDSSFALLFSLVFHHRTQLSLIKRLDNEFVGRYS